MTNYVYLKPKQVKHLCQKWLKWHKQETKERKEAWLKRNSERHWLFRQSETDAIGQYHWDFALFFKDEVEQLNMVLPNVSVVQLDLNTYQRLRGKG